ATCTGKQRRPKNRPPGGAEVRRASTRWPDVGIEPEQVGRVVFVLDPSQPRQVAAVVVLDDGRFTVDEVGVVTVGERLDIRPVLVQRPTVYRIVVRLGPRHGRTDDMGRATM